MAFPISEKETWSIKDSSKISTFLDCPRKYFYEHILGWRPDVPGQDAYFGEAIHKAREHQLLHGYEDIQGAYNAFYSYYREEFPAETDEIYRPKDAAGALHAITLLAEQRSSDLDENEVVELDGVKMTEISGTVPISRDQVLHYRLDSIMRRRADGKIFSWDHKTTKRFSRFWREQFHLSIQNGTYTHCLYCMFPIEQVLGIEFYGISFEYLKRNQEYRVMFEQVPAFKTPEQMNSWLWTVNTLVNEINFETEQLFECEEGDSVLQAFPMNPNSCTKYFGCPFHDFCLAWQNPLQQCYEVPLGFKEEFWDPSQMDTRVKKNLDW